MKQNHRTRLDVTCGNVFQKQCDSSETSAPFMVLPMPWNTGMFFQTAVSSQHILYSIASQQAAVVVEEVRRRHQMLFAGGVHLWN
jgi:hypothetical protein